jgi:hypothetical protein
MAPQQRQTPSIPQGASVRRTVIALTAAACLAGSAYSFYYFAIRPPYYGPDYGVWLEFVLPVVLLLASFGFLVWSFSDNIYNIKEGKVVGHSFEKAHMSPPVYVPGTPGTATTPGTPSIYVPGHWVPDTWSLQLEDARGRTGWISFEDNVFDQYPVGTNYPRVHQPYN